VALLGPNGAGKTTLLRLLSTAEPVQSGGIRIGGHSLSDPYGRTVVRRRLGVVPQGSPIREGLRCRDFLAYVAWLRDVPAQNADREVARALDAVELSDRATDRVKTLSGGMKQRLLLAQALVGAPAILVLDEPTVGLDPRQRHGLRGLLARLAHDVTLVIATHLVEDVAALAGDVVLLDEGRVGFCGSVRELVGGDKGDPVTGAQVEAAFLERTGTPVL